MATQLTVDQIQGLVQSASSSLSKTWSAMATALGTSMQPTTQALGASLQAFLQSPATNPGDWLSKAADFVPQMVGAAKNELTAGFKDDGTLAAVIAKGPDAQTQIKMMAAQVGGGGSNVLLLLGAIAIGAVSWWAYKSMSKKSPKALGRGDVDEFTPGEEDEPEEALSDWEGEDVSDDADDAEFDGVDDDDGVEDEPEEALSGFKKSVMRMSKRRAQREARWG